MPLHSNLAQSTIKLLELTCTDPADVCQYCALWVATRHAAAHALAVVLGVEHFSVNRPRPDCDALIPALVPTQLFLQQNEKCPSLAASACSGWGLQSLDQQLAARL